MANVYNLPVDVFLYILNYLDIHDRISFAFTCQMFRQICVDEGVFRKTDLSRRQISTTQRVVINTFFRDTQLTEHITELDLSNLRVLNWQMDDQLEEFIISICPHLKTLEVLDCGMSLQRLYRILQEAHQLTALSWSLWDFTSEDVEFLVNRIESSEGISLKGIKYLRLEMNLSSSHIQIAKYLVLSCQDLEELEIYTLWIDEDLPTRWGFPLAADQMIPCFLQPSIENGLQHLNSLMLVSLGRPILGEDFGVICSEMLFDFVFSVARSKSSSSKWKKFLDVIPSLGISRLIDLSLLLRVVHPCDLQSVEAIAADAACLDNAVDELKTFFERIGDSTVRNLYLCFPETNLIARFYESISRVGGHSLKFLCLAFSPHYVIEAERNIIHSLFSNCANISELDLNRCCFKKDICEALSELKHLTKVQLSECAISSVYNGRKVQISKANLLTFVENCKNVTHFDVRGCLHTSFSGHLTENDLPLFAKFGKLKSLTLYKTACIRDWTSLKMISEHCKFLTMLRIAVGDYIDMSNILIWMECAKFLKHLAFNVHTVELQSEVFWNLLSHAKNLERLCIRCSYTGSLNIPVAVKTLKSLPRLHVLHLHSHNIENVEAFYDEMINVFEEKESNCRFSFEIVLGYITDVPQCRWNCNKVLPLNLLELCDMRPIVAIPRM